MFNVGTLAGFLELEDRLSPALKLAEANLATTGAKLTDMGKTMSGLGGQLLPVSIAVGAVGLGVIKMASDFEDSFAGVRKTVDATEPELETLSDAFRQLATEIPASVTEINRVAEAGGQLGVKKEDLIGFTETMIAMGTATNLSSDEAATALAQIANIIDNSAGPSYDRMAATVVALGNAGASTESDIVNFGLRLAGAGKQAGLTEPQIFAFGSALASVGIQAEAGGSAFSKLFMEITKSVATGGADLTKFAEVAGLSAEDFATAFRDDPAEAITLFIEGLGDIGEAGGNLFGTLDSLEIKEIRMATALLNTAGAGDLVRKSIEDAEKAWKDNTALTEEAEKRYATFSSQVIILWNKITDLGITLGTALLPVLADVIDLFDPLIDGAKEAAEWFADLPTPVHALVLAFGAILVVSAPILLFFGALLNAAGAVVTAFGFLTGAFATTGTAAGIAAVPVAGFWTALLGPVGVGVAIAALIAGLITMNGWWDEIAGALKVAWQWFTDVGKIVLWLDQQILSSLWGMLKDIAGYVRDTVVLVFKYLYDELVSLAGYIPGLNTLWEMMGDVLVIVWDIVGKVVGVLSDLAGKAAKWLGDTFNELKAMADNGQAAITPLVSTLETDLAGRALPAVFYGMHDANDASVIYGDGLKDVEKHTKDVEKASEDYRKEIDELTKSLKGSGAIDSAKKYMDALIGVNDISKLTKDKQEEINEVIMAGIEAYRSQGREAPAEMLKVAIATSTLKDKVDALTLAEIAAVTAVGPNAWDASEKAMRDWGLVHQGLADQWLEWNRLVADPAPWAAADANVKAYMDSLETSIVHGVGISKTFGEKMREGLLTGIQDALISIPSIITGGIERGAKGSEIAGDVGAAIGSALGAIAGAIIGGPVGAAIGSALGSMAGKYVGVLVDALNRSGGEDVMRRVGRDWGVALTEELGDAISDTAENLFGGNRLAAEIFHFGDILEAAGGLNTENFDEMLEHLRDVFVMLETDVFNASDAITVLDDNFGTFAEHATANGGLVTDAFLEIIRLADDAGLHIQAIDDFVTGQVTAAVEGITLMLLPAYDLITVKEEELKQLRIDAADASEDEIGALLERIGVLEGELVALTGVTIQTQDAATGFAAAIFASFGELIKRGMDTKDALELIKPAVDVLQQEMIDLGFDGGEAFDLLARMSVIAGDEIAGPMVDAIHGGADALTGLHNAGILNQTMFTGLTTQITTTFNALVRQSGDGGAALQLLAPDIQRVWELQQDFGYAVDDATQLLIDQGIEAGLVGDAHRDAQDVAILAMNNAADAMMRVALAIEAAFLNAGAASAGFADTVNSNVSSIPSNPFSGWQIPSLNMPSIPDYPGSLDNLDVYPMAAGGTGKVSSPTLFLAGEAGPEEWAFSGAGRSFSDYGGSRSNVHDDEVHQELVAIRRGQSDLPFVLVRALQTARALD